MQHQDATHGRLLSRHQLLRTKLRPPIIAHAIARERLFVQLDAVLDRALTLVASPAGFGKTTLVAAWLNRISQRAELQVATAWLSLDAYDDDPARFLAYLIAAFEGIDPAFGRGLDAALRSSHAFDTEALLTALLNNIVAAEDAAPRPILLVLDDYHALEHPQIDIALAFLLEHLPSTLHLIVLSRIDPPLPLARLRARGQLLEIRTNDLRFSSDEARALLCDLLRVPLSANDVQRLTLRTEGWGCGLQLAALAIQSTDMPATDFIREFAGTHRYVMDYLTDEVLQRQPPAIKRFLLETSVLERLCAPLCDAVREQSDGQEILEQLEQKHLFVVPLDEERRWYRYHQLFAELLRHRLAQAAPVAPAALHRRAAMWYAQHTAADDSATVDLALGHAAAARDHALTAALLDRFGDVVWEQGAHDQLRRWLAELPGDIMAVHPKLGVFWAWLHVTGGHSAEAETSLAQAEHALGDAERTIHGRIAATRAFIATFKADTTQTIQHAQGALQLLAGDRSAWRAGAAIALADAYALGGDTRAAGAAYQEALAASQASGSLYLTLNAAFKLAAILRQQGQLRAAHDLCDLHIAHAERSGLAQTTMAGCLYALRGDILCEWNQLDEALAQTQHAIDTCAVAHHQGLVGWISLYRARCLLAARRLNDADSVLRALEADTALPPWIASPAAALRALLWLVQGDVAATAAWPRMRSLAVTDVVTPARELEQLVFARILATQGRHEEAQAVLDRVYESSAPDGRANIAIVALLLRALLCQAARRPAPALAALTEALRLAEPGGFVRIFVEAGPALIPLLQALATESDTSYAHRLLPAFEPASAPSARPELPEPLSTRERQVLRLIAEGHPNQAIAGRLVISLNTVLYHTKNIYGKLGAANRTQAVQRARELGLL